MKVKIEQLSEAEAYEKVAEFIAAGVGGIQYLEGLGNLHWQILPNGEEKYMLDCGEGFGFSIVPPLGVSLVPEFAPLQPRSEL